MSSSGITSLTYFQRTYWSRRTKRSLPIQAKYRRRVKQEKKMTSEQHMYVKPSWHTVTSGYWQQQIEHILQQIKLHAQNDIKFRAVVQEAKIGQLVQSSQERTDNELVLTLTFALSDGIASDSKRQLLIGERSNLCTEDNAMKSGSQLNSNVTCTSSRASDWQNNGFHQFETDILSCEQSKSALWLASSDKLLTLTETHSQETKTPQQGDNTQTSLSKYHERNQRQRTYIYEKKYTCDFCEKTFDNDYHLVRHRRIHTGDKPYVCSFCNKAFADQSAIVKHRRIHTGEKPYKCDICVKEFTISGHLAEHRRIHTGEKPFQCDTCDKAFARSSHLANHRRIHTGEKPFHCHVCGQSFRQLGGLSSHRQRKHPVEKA